MSAARLLVATALCLVSFACSSSERSAFAPDDLYDSDDSPDAPPAPAPPPSEFGDQAEPVTPEETEVNEVYGHSSKTLYKLEPKTKDVTVVGNFTCNQVTDIALDESSMMYAVSFEGLYRIDKATAACTLIKRGTSYPNSLSFVPKGTLDPEREALVGYEQDKYVRIDTQTGAITVIGNLGPGGLRSSGDIVSVKGGKTYLTVKDNARCKTSDCLVEVDPKTGAIVHNWGSIEHDNVFGIAFWGGRVYGFNDKGTLFEVTFGQTQLSTQPIAIPQRPSGLSFWGAGSSTSVPLDFGPQ